MKFLKTCVIIFVSLACLPGLIFSGEIIAKSAISSVTLFPDRAAVVREAGLTLSPGVHPVVIGGLPSSLLPESLRVSGKGEARVKILGLELATEFLEAPLQEEIQKLQAEIGRLQFEIDGIRESIDVVLAKEKFLKSLSEGTAQGSWKEILSGQSGGIQAWERVLAFLGKNLQEVKLEKLDLQKKLREKEEKLETLKKKLDSIRPQKPLEGKKATILLEAGSAGSFTLSLSYMVRNALWTPAYSIRALPDSSEVELTFSGEIRQKTGENWESVEMNLSTSTPSTGVNPPELRPWIIRLYEPPPELRMRAEEKKGVIGGVMGGVMAAAPVEAELDAALIQETGLHLNFGVKRKVSVPSDGAPHKVPIAREILEAPLDYVTIPKLRETAFLRAQLRNTLAYPLLSGNALLFILEEFVGSGRIPAIAAEEEAKIFFGEDSQVRVKHEQLAKKKIAPGFLGKTEKTALSYRITVQNFRKKAVTIDVIDQLPMSQSSQVEVKDVKLTPPPSRKEENGFLTWTVNLSPQEKKEILIEFTVEYPKDSRIIGL